MAAIQPRLRSRLNCWNETRVAASTTQVPLFTLFAPTASLDLEATSSNNVKGGTMLAEARSAYRVHSSFLIPNS